MPILQCPASHGHPPRRRRTRPGVARFGDGVVRFAGIRVNWLRTARGRDRVSESPSGMFTNKFKGLARQGQHFFFAKKKQKTLTWSAVSCLRTQLNEQKFFGSFFQKRMLSSSAPCFGCHTFRTDSDAFRPFSLRRSRSDVRTHHPGRPSRGSSRNVTLFGTLAVIPGGRNIDVPSHDTPCPSPDLIGGGPWRVWRRVQPFRRLV